ncbi:FAD-dependent thymidylate synthase [Clostridioides difficile]|nr:FAD-dependent thymidylate synthase [Clostridioides difficile]HBH3655612.1 FAD-dependent thymidylate synthase [Clostridioides difficile]
MKVYLNEITGIDDAIVSMFMSKRSWTREKELEIRRICNKVLDNRGKLIISDRLSSELKQFNKWMDSLVKWGWTHTTMLRFIDMSITVEGLHRAGQDDWDSHAKRFNNRIIRSSTRLADFEHEISEWYEDKIIPTDIALQHVNQDIPKTIKINGINYVKVVNGYIREDLKDNKDVKRGLYMLSIPSNFIFKVNMTEWGHVYKERNNNSSANPEVKLCCESIANQIESFHSQFNRDLFKKIKN